MINEDEKFIELNQALKENLRTYLSQYRMLTDAINIKDAFVINIGVEFEIVTFKNFNNQTVLKKCLEELRTFFNIKRWQINQPIIISEIFNKT